MTGATRPRALPEGIAGTPQVGGATHVDAVDFGFEGRTLFGNIVGGTVETVDDEPRFVPLSQKPWAGVHRPKVSGEALVQWEAWCEAQGAVRDSLGVLDTTDAQKLAGLLYLGWLETELPGE